MLKLGSKKSMTIFFCNFSFLKLKPRVHYEKVSLGNILISSFPSPNQLCLSNKKAPQNKCFFPPGPIGPYTGCHVETNNCVPMASPELSDHLFILILILSFIYKHMKNVYFSDRMNHNCQRYRLHYDRRSCIQYCHSLSQEQKTLELSKLL